ncbi:MAG: ubiquitin-like protein Pup [Actinobacteria bacterium]|nr:ubiquitin-like protein Pup [Actinomycetota bacterium]
MAQDQIREHRSAGEPEPVEPPPAPAAAAAHDFSQVLADIDDILETNALTFVQGFVQEGGE